MPCILRFEIEYSLEFFSTNLLFYPVLPTPRFKQLLFGGTVATVKIQKNWKRTSLDVFFSICKSQDRAITRQRIIQPKLINCPSDTFLKFCNSPIYKSPNTQEWRGNYF